MLGLVSIETSLATDWLTLYLHQRVRPWVQSSSGFRTHPLRMVENAREVDLALKQAIARHLREAVYTNRLRVRDRFLRGLAHPRFDQLLLVTTNWDPEAREALPQFQRLEPAPSPRGCSQPQAVTKPSGAKTKGAQVA